MNPTQHQAIAALLQRLDHLVCDWNANGNTRPLGDPTADVWHECARRLLDAMKGES